MAYELVPRLWQRRRALILTICVVYGAVLLAYVLMTPATNLDNVVVMEVLLCTVVLYAGSVGRRGVSGWAGTLGFAAWAAFYRAQYVVGQPGVDAEEAG